MTVTAQGLSPQPLTTLGIGSQPGFFSPAFPNPMGAEQFLGIPQGQGYQPSIWPQPAYAWQSPYGMPTPAYGQQPWAVQAGNNGLAPFSFAPFATAPFGTAQQGIGFGQQQLIGLGEQQQLIGQLVGQILPLAQQMILPQVIAMAVPLVQQLMTQLAASQLIAQPSSAQHGAGSFVPGVRQYAGLS